MSCGGLVPWLSIYTQFLPYGYVLYLIGGFVDPHLDSWDSLYSFQSSVCVTS